MDFEHPTLQGVNAMIIRVTQGVASLALGYALLPFQGVHYRQKTMRKMADFAEPQPILSDYFAKIRFSF